MEYEQQQSLKLKDKQKQEMLKALGHCNEVVGRMLYNAEYYFNIKQNNLTLSKYNGHKTEINSDPQENEIQIKLRLIDQMQNSMNIIKLFNMNSKKFKKMYSQINESDLASIIKDINLWIDNFTDEEDKNIYIIIREILLGKFNGSLQEIRNKISNLNKISNKNFRERRPEDIANLAPYTMEAINDVEKNIEKNFESNENYIPKIRRGESSSSNPINKYDEEMKTMKLINEYRIKAMNDICKKHNNYPLKRADCYKCMNEIDAKCNAMYHQ